MCIMGNVGFSAFGDLPILKIRIYRLLLHIFFHNFPFNLKLLAITVMHCSTGGMMIFRLTGKTETGKKGLTCTNVSVAFCSRHSAQQISACISSANTQTHHSDFPLLLIFLCSLSCRTQVSIKLCECEACVYVPSCRLDCLLIRLDRDPTTEFLFLNLHKQFGFKYWTH